MSMTSHYQIIDANLNRAAEGLRVIEDYVRFVLSLPDLSMRLASIRHQIGQAENTPVENLLSRHTQTDARAQDPPKPRISDRQLLKANFKRVEEALRSLEEYTVEGPFNTLRYEVYELEKEVLLQAGKPSINEGVYLISHDPEVLLKGIACGVSLIQLRDKKSNKDIILNKAQYIKDRLSGSDVVFIVNDFYDIAQIVDADGLHTGQDDIPVKELKKIIGPHKLVGRTTHSVEQGLLAQSQGADYVSVGPVWETPSKPGRDGIGFEYLKAAQEFLHIPYVAIGGISAKNCDEILEYKPPLIGLIRDYENIPTILAKIRA